MSTTYLLWKDPDCKGINPQWLTLNRKEFLDFLKTPEACNRYFMKLSSINDDSSDGRIVIEATKAQFKEFEKERLHAHYLREINPGYIVISYNAFDDEDYDCYGEDFLRDSESEFVNECIEIIEKELIRRYVLLLTEEEQNLINYLYGTNEQGTIRGYAKVSGLKRSTIHRMKTTTLEKLRNYLQK